MSTYVPVEQQLGFEVFEDRGTFVAQTRDGDELCLVERSEVATYPNGLHANVRVMVADREYGLHDFRILDPDGFGLRFGSRLQGQPVPSSA
jgi:hypothetical protein